MKSIIEIIQQKQWIGWLLFIFTIFVVFLIGLFGASIMERRSEEKLAFQLVKPINDWEPRNEVWGENFPREFETYKSTFDTTFASKYGGSAKRDLLEDSPEAVILWAGYAFSRQYNQARGHYHAVEDIQNTLRTGVPQPATCWTCKSTDVPRLMNKMGVKEFYKSKWSELGHEVTNNIGCQDCHDTKTMNLRITRPSLLEALQRNGKDINNITHQEMRSYVCAQCHVEYYFKGKEEKYLTFPWDKGFSVEAMEEYYDENAHTDWEHKLSKAKMLKAQHPDYEMFATGIHFERGLSCADCHMPYKSEGGVKFTNHKIQSPLNDVASSCGVCHRENEETLIKNVNDRQDKIRELRVQAEKSLFQLHIETKTAWEKGAKEEEMKPILKFIRHAQWRWDFVSATNGSGFHSPIEAARILGSSIQKSQEGRILLARILAKYGITEEIQMPDIYTKEKAQKFIGLKMDSLQTVKNDFLNNTVVNWNKTKKNY